MAAAESARNPWLGALMARAACESCAEGIVLRQRRWRVKERIMPDLAAYQQAAVAAGHGEMIVLDADGGLRPPTRTEKLMALAGREPGQGAQAARQDFAQALLAAYGPEILNDLPAGHPGLEAGPGAGPLTPQVVNQAVNDCEQRVNQRLMMKDDQHKLENTQRNERAQNYVPQPQVALAALNVNHVDQGEGAGQKRVHFLLARNNSEPTVGGVPGSELDRAVNQEMARLAGNPADERLRLIQARLNVMDQVIHQAAQVNPQRPGGAATNVFLGPDMFFSDMQGAPSRQPDGSMLPTSGGCLTEEEMKLVTRGLAEISARNPNVTLMPGTILWSRPVENAPEVDGRVRPADQAFNMAPVFQGGELIHCTYKLTDGGDAKWAAEGVKANHGERVPPPAPSNDYNSRAQIFLNPAGDGGNPRQPFELELMQEMRQHIQPGSPGRQWEDALRGGAPQQSPHNNIFMCQGQVVALEICRDHANEFAREQMNQADANEMADPVSQAVVAGQGADYHITLSAGGGLIPGKTITKQNGVSANVDSQDGVMKSWTAKPDNAPAQTFSNSINLNPAAIYINGQRANSHADLPAGMAHLAPAALPPAPPPAAGHAAGGLAV